MQRIHPGDEPPGGEVVAPPDLAHKWQVTLHPGDSLGIENMSRKNGTGTSGELFYAVKGKIKPCEAQRSS